MAVQREVVAQARLGKDTMMRRSLMQVLTAEKAQNLRFVFGCWAQVRANGKPKDRGSLKMDQLRNATRSCDL